VLVIFAAGKLSAAWKLEYGEHDVLIDSIWDLDPSFVDMISMLLHYDGIPDPLAGVLRPSLPDDNSPFPIMVRARVVEILQARRLAVGCGNVWVTLLESITYEGEIHVICNAVLVHI
jgi:hypothetical protein